MRVTRGAGATGRSRWSRCTTWRCWSASPGRWTGADPSTGGSCPSASRCCARLEQERGDAGTREYIEVLQLLEGHSLAQLQVAVERGLCCNALIRDAIAQFLIPQEDWGQTTFALDGREHLRHVQVAETELSGYAGLLAAGGGGS